MSFFSSLLTPRIANAAPSTDSFGASNSASQDPSMEQAVFTIEAMTGFFNGLTETCNKKCITKFKDNELALGEATCVDRCVVKYMQSRQIVQKVLEAATLEQMQQQQQMAGK